MCENDDNVKSKIEILIWSNEEIIREMKKTEINEEREEKWKINWRRSENERYNQIRRKYE